MKIFCTRMYERKAKKLLSADEKEDAEASVIADPEKWPVISGTGGIRKARAGRGDAGKSGGVRILYYVLLADNILYFMDIYPKNEKENISSAEKKLLKSLVTAFHGEPHHD